MTLTIDQKSIFKAMQAIEIAMLRRLNATDSIRVDSREAKEMNFLTKLEFRLAMMDLKKNGAIKLEDVPGEDAHPTQRHFQLRKTPKFASFYKKLKGEYPNLMDISIAERVAGQNFTCHGLTFDADTGNFRYGRTKGCIEPHSSAWSALSLLLLRKNKPTDRDQMEAAIVSGWRTATGKRKGKSVRSIDIEKVIRNIRRKLRMGKVKNSINPDLIKGGNDNKTYRLMCR